jgi:hypothetical protein
MTRWAILLVALAACSDGEGPQAVDLAGTWSGTYTNSTSSVPYEAVMELEQDGQLVTGTLATTAGRTAEIEGEADVASFTATITYTDGCEGTAEAEANAPGDRLVGTYTSSDCTGETTGNFNLTREGE